MKAVRYFALALFVCAQTLALAQSPSDSVVVIAGGLGPGIVAPGRTAQFGAQFVEGEPVGPVPMVLVEPSVGCVEDPGHPDADAAGYIPAVENPEEIEGNIALISRGSCAFATKVKAAAEAVAVAAVIYNNWTTEGEPPDTAIAMGGECTVEEGCTVPAAFVSYNSGMELLMCDFCQPAVINPIRITSPVASEPELEGRSFGALVAFPNPTASHATVRLHLPSAQAVRVAVFDVLGRRVAVLHDGPFGAGTHRLRLDAAALPAGVYVVRATAGNERVTRKLVVAR